MGIGILTSGNSWSSVEYTGSPIPSRFVLTTDNQQLIEFKSKDGKPISLNSLTIEADAVDLYFSLWVRKSGKDVADVNFANEPVLFCPAGETITISGLGVGAIKFSNDLGAGYFIQGLSY